VTTVADQVIASSPHRHSGATVQGVMLRVAAALVPGLIAYVLNFGIGVVIQCLLAVAFAIATEYFMLKLRRRPVALHLKDGSAIVTALLLALCLSPLTPWWITLIATVFAVALAKHAFGGLGHNLFNPAMAGYAFVLLCFPAQMNLWPAAPAMVEHAPSAAAYAAAIFAPGAEIDALSGATALGRMKSQLGLMEMVSEIRAQPVFGTLAGSGWEWVAAGWLAGGVLLLAMGVIRWQVPAAMLGALFAVSALFHIYDSDVYAPPLFHLFAGATLLGAFFIATDPVTASTTPRGRIIYGGLIGVLAWVIRTWGAYPDGVAFAVLIGNAAAPLIDHFTRPRVLGENTDGT
jgi:electron transport complex protein RnfD